MTPEQMYKAPFHEKNSDLDWIQGCYYNHIPELPEFPCLPVDDPNDRVEVRVHAELVHDVRRYHIIRSLWFDNNPVMVCVNAGREGDDHNNRWVTDSEAYQALVSYLLSILDIEPEMEIDFVQASVDQPGMTDFYGQDLITDLGKRSHSPTF